MNRRRFFREGFRELLRPLASSVLPIEKMVDQLAKLDPVEPAAPKNPPPAKMYLRPPGALDEADFANKCTLCNECVKVCPAQAIKIDWTKQTAGGLPFIDADTTACVVCSGLSCMHECPTGALLPTPLRQINMGLAQWDAHSCIRTKGRNCTICVDECPLGSAAIEIQGPKIRVIESGCIGCGVCQNRCPTEPTSIWVQPRQAI